MRLEIDELLARTGRVATRHQLLQVVTRNQFDHEVAAGYLVAVFPRAYCRPWDADDPAVRERAAVLSTGGAVALSHLSALRRYRLTVPPGESIHVTVGVRRHPIHKLPGLIVHRTRVRTRVRRVDGLPVVDPAVAVVRSWPLLPGPDRRGPAIEAVRNRLVTPAELRAAAARAVGMRGRVKLVQLTDLLASGCESELEIWVSSMSSTSRASTTASARGHCASAAGPTASTSPTTRSGWRSSWTATGSIPPVSSASTTGSATPTSRRSAG